MVRVCSIEGCGKPHDSRGWCGAHAQRWRRTGDPLGSITREYKLRLTSDGYLYIFMPNHPAAFRNGKVLEHRRVAWDAGMLNSLNLHLVVHHIDENPLNNEVSNLQVVTKEEHAALHHPSGPKVCSVEACEKQVFARGWCHMHYSRWRRHGVMDLLPKPMVCSVDGCGETEKLRIGLCCKHYMRQRRYGSPTG